MIPDKESWCDSVIPIVILEAIDVIRNQLRTPRCNYQKSINQSGNQSPPAFCVHLPVPN